ncbi:MAG: cytochrome c [Planctomycetales bacterium]|nr:cytochrome c [Planctomycetales bacterium]
MTPTLPKGPWDLRSGPCVAGAFLLALLAAGCGPSPEELDRRYPPGKEAAALAADKQAALAAELEKTFGTPAAPKLDLADAKVPGVDLTRLAHGRDRFRHHCSHCHGWFGRGDGPTAEWVNPRPRNLWRGKFKFKSTELAAKPTREDLLRIVNLGAHGTAMPSFALYPAGELEAIVDYVIHLAVRGEVELLAADDIRKEGKDPATAVKDSLEIVGPRWERAPGKVVTPAAARPPLDAASIARGKALFQGEKGGCVKCHGKEGRGDADPEQVKVWDKQQEEGLLWESPSRPADLTVGMYRGGQRPVDLFRRITEGILPMPGFGSSLSESERWDLVNFVKSLPYEEERKP